jgi:hypothetical protein
MAGLFFGKKTESNGKKENGGSNISPPLSLYYVNESNEQRSSSGIIPQ